MDNSPSTPRRSARIQRQSSSTVIALDETSTKLTNTSTPSKPTTSTSSLPNMTTTTRTRSALSPFLPTTLETTLLAIYPLTLLAGSLFALLDPVARAAPYNDITQSHYANTAPSYFAKKSNVFNVFFVKRGWAWVSLAYFFFLFTHPANGRPYTLDATSRRTRGATRHALVTIWWIFVTQWFFGPAIIDRGFVLTGGQCELVEAVQQGKVDTVMSKEQVLITGLACKAVGGRWKGGHDISGHVFLLVLGSMFLALEVLHVTLKYDHREEARVITLRDGAVKSAIVETNRVADLVAQESGQWTLAAKFALGVAALSVYMLLMTAAYFHTWFEKLSGLLTALIGIFVVYSLPRGVPAMRAIVGMPGI